MKTFFILVAVAGIGGLLAVAGYWFVYALYLVIVVNSGSLIAFQCGALSALAGVILYKLNLL